MTKHKATDHKSTHPAGAVEAAKPHAEETAKPAATETAKPAADGRMPPVEMPPPEDPAAPLRAELQAAKDRELRCHAELDNYRKRASRELEDRLRYANMGLLHDLLPVIDNVDRAIEAAEKNADAGALLEGFKMVSRQLEDALNRHHCKRIEALHAPFDPHVHHAILQQPSNEHPANTVLMVTQNGYQLHDRVVRPAQVIVSKTE